MLSKKWNFSWDGEKVTLRVGIFGFRSEFCHLIILNVFLKTDDTICSTIRAGGRPTIKIVVAVQ